MAIGYYDLEHQTAEQVAQLEAQGVGAPGGDLSGTIPVAVVATVHSGKAVTDNTQALGGDLSGTLPSPTVAKVNGNSIPAGAQLGQGLLASAASTLGWVDPRTLSGVTMITNPKYGAKCDALAVTDGAMSAAGTNILTSASNPFGSAVAGMTVKVAGAGNSAGTLDLITTILSVDSNGQVHLNANCLATGGVSGAQVVFGTDDTAAVQAALNVAGDTVVKAPAGTSLILSSITPAQATLDLMGVTVYQCLALNKGLFANATGTSDKPITNRFHVLGGVYIGTNNEQQNQSVHYVTNIVDFLVRDAIQLGYQAFFVQAQSCQRQRFEDNTVFTAGNPPGAQNYISVLYNLSGAAVNSPSDIICTGNIFLCPNGSCASMAVVSSNVTNSNQAFPVNLVCANNDFTIKGAGFDCECGGSGASVFYFQRAVIANNVITALRTSTYWAITIADDSSGGSTDPTLISDVIVTGNTIYSTTGGIHCQGQRSIVGWNTIRLAGTTSSNNAIALDSHGGARITDAMVIGNLLSIVDGQIGVNILISGYIGALVAFNKITYDTGASGSTDAIQFLNCTQCDSRFNIMRNLPGRGMRWSNSRDMTSAGDKIVNPCIASGNAGMFFDNTGGGYYYVSGAQFFGGISTPNTPVVSASGTGSTVGAGTYFVKTTYVNAAGETTPSPESTQLTVTAGQNIVISSPAADANASSWKAYVTLTNGATNTETLQGGTNAIGTNLTITTNPVAGAALPASNTTSKMSFCLNNQGTPASLKGSNNSPIGGVNTSNTNGAYSALTTF